MAQGPPAGTRGCRTLEKDQVPLPGRAAGGFPAKATSWVEVRGQSEGRGPGPQGTPFLGVAWEEQLLGSQEEGRGLHTTANQEAPGPPLPGGEAEAAQLWN